MLISAFIFGLVSSLHCIGMCGPIALVLPVDRKNSVRKILQILTYQFGRVITYSTLGLVFGILGRTLYLAGFQQRLSIFAGVAMVIFALVPEKKLNKYNFSGPVYRMVASVRNSLGTRLRNKSFKSLFTVGILNGLLPCGLVYAALFGSVAMEDIGTGILFMALFGIGTMPLMSAAPYVHSLLTMPVRIKIQKVIPITVAIIGVLFIIRGLGMGIPYLSPSDMSLFVKANPECH